ncbi:MAG: hypothetical protein R3C11_05160 [Planctomycetaceae bacterium]
MDEIANGLPENEVVITEVNSFRSRIDEDAQQPTPAASSSVAPAAAEATLSLPPMVDRVISHTLIRKSSSKPISIQSPMSSWLSISSNNDQCSPLWWQWNRWRKQLSYSPVLI